MGLVCNCVIKRRGLANSMGRQARTIELTRVLVDAILLVAAFFLAFQIRVSLKIFPELEDWGRYDLLVFVAIATWLPTAHAAGLYRAYVLPLGHELSKLVWPAVVTGLVMASLAFLLKQEYQSRPLVVLYTAAAFAMTATFRMLVATGWFGTITRSHRVIVVGSGPEAEQICRTVRRGHDSGLELVGVIPEEKGVPVPPGAIRLGEIEQCEAIFRREIVDEVIFAIPRTKLFEVEAAFEAAEDLGIPTKLCLTFLPNRFSRVSFERVDSTPMLSFSSAPGKPVQLALKRAFDIVVSALALALCAPLFFLVALAIKLDSRGPVFFRQQRTGLNGREFWMLKFRSMSTDAETRLKELQKHNEMSGPVFKIKDDPRVTRVGRLIRKASIDELPQFWNVLVGDMSVVGPRPLFDVKQYDERWQVRRLSVRPGITCTWQISGRNEIDFPTWMKLDLDYIDRWSLVLDLQIFFKTIPAVLFGRGAR
jgi:exopolysaccharide biosynthesis polyprenyl glycosylphosphotransferase